jgi:hypothetical protein
MSPNRARNAGQALGDGARAMERMSRQTRCREGRRTDRDLHTNILEPRVAPPAMNLLRSILVRGGLLLAFLQHARLTCDARRRHNASGNVGRQREQRSHQQGRWLRRRSRRQRLWLFKVPQGPARRRGL